MFDTLSKRLTGIFDRLRGRGALTENDVTTALREVRVALLEADVALPALKSFIERVKAKAIGEEILQSITPTQMIIKIVHDELVALLSHPQQSLFLRSAGPTCFLMVGLQGSGKTTMCGKIAFLMKERKKKVLMASLDTYRPAAQQQLAIIGASLGVDTLEIVPDERPLAIAQRALQAMPHYDLLILDTAGRLHVSSDMMEELIQIKALTSPHEVLFIADALSGQDAVRTAQAFHEAVPITGVCLSRVDGDGRGGAALSLRYCTQCPIKLMGTGERPQQVMPFDAQQIADRILDKGDIIGLVEKAAQVLDQQEQERALKRLEKGIFTLDDLASRIRQIEKMGGIKGVLEFIPGIRGFKDQLQGRINQANFKHQLAIISSMTPQERRQPSILNASRKRRIAQGSGTSVPEVNRLLQQFTQMQKMMKQMKGFWPKA